MEPWQESGLRNVGKLDEAAAEYHGDLPDVVVDALAFGIATAVSRIQNHETSVLMLKALLALGKNCYRVGYINGRSDTSTLLGAKGE